MKLVSLKKEQEFPLKGVANFKMVRKDGSISRIIIEDAEGNLAEINAEYSNLQVYVPKPPVVVKRYKLHGKFLELMDVNELFEFENEAQSKLDDYESKSGKCGNTGLKIDEVEVLEA